MAAWNRALVHRLDNPRRNASDRPGAGNRRGEPAGPETENARTARQSCRADRTVSDPIFAQVLAASTYPLEIVEAARSLKANSNLKGEALTKAAAKQEWDPSVQALVAFPEVLKRLDEGLQWTTDLGNAFLEQQSDVMDAAQRMRKKSS